jgi:hypothetical protein
VVELQRDAAMQGAYGPGHWLESAPVTRVDESCASAPNGVARSHLRSS